ncbi:MAG TPA: hypothetical protein VF746_30195 [Longimicrobium sp.]|jgi:hypothetical protein
MTAISSPAEAALTEPETPPAGLRALARMGRSGWGAFALICGSGAVLGTALGAGVFGSPLMPGLLAAVMLVSGGRALLRWLRAGEARTDIRARTAGLLEKFGGGPYGSVALATWLWLEVGSLRGDWLAARGLWDFLEQLSLQWFFGFGAESLLNAVWAFFWWLYWPNHVGFLFTFLAAALAWGLHALAGRWPAPGRAPAEPGLAG